MVFYFDLHRIIQYFFDSILMLLWIHFYIRLSLYSLDRFGNDEFKKTQIIN